MPLLFGSWWALVPVLVAIPLIGLRTYLEDRTLQAGLPGYLDYAKQVRYRIFPGVW
jgi:protein-S-isoprenylcysteine O-methyltransferase Ste14